MHKLSFSLDDYQHGLKSGLFEPPEALCPYYEVDQLQYRKLEATKLRRGQLGHAINELRKRTGDIYFRTTYPLQAKTLDYSTRTFPAYRFILPEVMTEDWLAIVDWGKFQRDHILHQPLCGYVMLKMLDCLASPVKLPVGNTLLDFCVDRIVQWEGTGYIKKYLVDCGMKEDDPILDNKSPIARNVWRIFFREAAYIAAIYHDLGYPWKYAEQMQVNLGGINTPAVKQNRNPEQIVDLFGHRLLFKPFFGYDTKMSCPSTWNQRIMHLTNWAMTGTHGFPGALGFLHLNDCVRRYPPTLKSPLHMLCVEWIAVAIMMHDMKSLYWGESDATHDIPQNPFLRLSFDRDPLSAIVTLVDILQEFERPSVVFGAVGKAITLDYNIACSSTEVSIDRNKLTICYKMQNDSMRVIKLRSIKKELKEVFDAKYGYLDLSSAGIDEVVMIVS